MSWHRIWAIILRFLYYFRHSLDRVMDNFYWPALDLLLWGLTSTYFSSFFEDAGLVVAMIVSSILFWVLVYRAQYEVSGNLLEDLWNKNLVNLFVSPLTFWEWVGAFLVLGLLKAAMSWLFALALGFILYGVNILDHGFYLAFYVPLLIMNGWWMGFLISGLILRFGTRVQTFGWTMIWVISPFAALYYPVSTLPQWAQYISYLLPISYVFEGSRAVLSTGQLDLSTMALAFILNIFYLALTLWFMYRGFAKVLDRGLVKLY